MILYHGSNMAIKQPRLIPSKRLLDFGTAFYLTSDFEQAQKWAVRTTNIRESGIASVSVYDFDEKCMNSLSVLTFEAPNRAWLRFVAANRTASSISGSYDIVIGPVANDQVIRTVNDFLNGYFTEDIAIQLLLPQKLKDQYAFKTEVALNYLHFKEVLS